jgi:hypothetical protein
MTRIATNRRFLSVGLLLMGLMIALGALGVGFGLWSKVLTIDGTVSTGEVNAEFSLNEIDQGDDGQAVDPLFWEGDSACDTDTDVNDDCEIEGKDVADCTAELITASPPDLPNPGSQLLEIEITDGYPSFHCWVQFDVTNNGTIPIKVHQPVITNPAPGAVTVEVLPPGNHGPGPTNDSVCYHDNSINPFPPPQDTTHPQLEPLETAFCVIHIHVEQDAEQNAGGVGGPPAYTFQATICAHQWNEETNDCVTALP